MYHFRHISPSHLSQMCTFVDPRLISKSVYDFPIRYGIKSYPSIQNFFRSLVKAAEVIKGVELEGRVVIVTGANSGLGERGCIRMSGFYLGREGYVSHPNECSPHPPPPPHLKKVVKLLKQPSFHLDPPHYNY